MSNAIRFRKDSHIQVLTPDFFNVEAYRAFLDTVPHTDNVNEVPGHDAQITFKSEEEMNINTAWWFLGRNSIFNVNGSVVIHFGHGRSEHTYRDFRATLDVLKQFFTRPHSVKFYVAEEGDGYKTTFVWPVEFTKGYDN